jgi:hypothetical protein
MVALTIALSMAGCTGCGREGDKFLGVLDLQRLSAYAPPVKMLTGSYSIRAAPVCARVGHCLSRTIIIGSGPDLPEKGAWQHIARHVRRC